MPAVTLNPAENLLLGACGGALETTLQMPILTAKFKFQNGLPLPRTIGGYYAGIGPQVLSVAPVTAMQVVLNGMFELAITQGGTVEMTDMQKIGCAMGAGASSALIYSPADCMTIQQQKTNATLVDTGRGVFKQHGLRGLYRAVIPTAIREALYTCGYLGLGPVLADHLSKPSFGQSDFMATLTGSIIAGTIATTFSHPIDTAKTRMQTDLSRRVYPTLVSTLQKIVMEEGSSALFKGLLPRCLRTIGAFVVMINLRQAVLDYKATATA